MRRFGYAIPAVVLFAISCALPAVTFSNTNSKTVDTMPGIQCFLLGPLAILVGQFSWLANPMFVLGLVALLLKWRRASLVLAMLGLFFTLHAFALRTNPMPANEGGVGELVWRAFGTGYYCWVASMAALACGALVSAIGREGQPQS